MPVTLSQAAQNTTDAVDLNVINDLRTSPLFDRMVFADVVNPAGGGATMTYTYRRMESLGSAQFRAINAEYRPTEATTTRHSTDLKPLGGSFQVDRLVAQMGPAASGEVSLQLSAKVEAAKSLFSDATINGDSAKDPDSFDGLSKALAGSSTEVRSDVDWSVPMDTTAKGLAALELVDDLLGRMQGGATLIIGNARALARLKSASRAADIYTTAAGPRETTLERYGANGPILVDAGKTADGRDVVPITNGLTDLYAVRIGLDGFHGVTTMGGNLVKTWLPDFTSAGAVKTGEVEIGPVGVALKSTKAAAVARGIRVAAA